MVFVYREQLEARLGPCLIDCTDGTFRFHAGSALSSSALSSGSGLFQSPRARNEQGNRRKRRKEAKGRWNSCGVLDDADGLLAGSDDEGAVLLCVFGQLSEKVSGYPEKLLASNRVAYQASGYHRISGNQRYADLVMKTS